VQAGHESGDAFLHISRFCSLSESCSIRSDSGAEEGRLAPGAKEGNKRAHTGQANETSAADGINSPPDACGFVTRWRMIDKMQKFLVEGGINSGLKVFQGQLHGLLIFDPRFPTIQLSQSCVRDGRVWLKEIPGGSSGRTFRRGGPASSLRGGQDSSPWNAIGAVFVPIFGGRFVRQGVYLHPLHREARSHQCKSFVGAREAASKGTEASPCAGSGTRGFAVLLDISSTSSPGRVQGNKSMPLPASSSAARQVQFGIFILAQRRRGRELLVFAARVLSPG